MTDANPDSKDWFFSYGGEEVFFFAFAPFYGSNHSRSTNGIDSVFIIIQPDRSFSYHLNRVGGREKFNEIRMKIREKFQKICQDYVNLEHNKNDELPPEYINIIKSPFQSYRNIKPLNNGDNVVKWWKK